MPGFDRRLALDTRLGRLLCPARVALAFALVAAALTGCGGQQSTTTVYRTVSSPAQSSQAHSSTTKLATATHASGTKTVGVNKSVGASNRPLAGKTVGVDPGHNGHNYLDPQYIDRLIWNGREMETCNTTGTETDGGYTEAQFNFNVAMYLAAMLRAQGAKVVLTRHTNTGVGPCVNQRAEIINNAHADVAIAIHADGGPPDGRGFAILTPVADGPNNQIIGSADRFALVLRRQLLRTGMPTSTYDGVDGIQPRDDLAGLNLVRVPEVYLECGNMRNATDASLLVTPTFQRSAARAIDRAILKFLR
jgi:N-acetylmuramoyl-L-alanine amidase